MTKTIELKTKTIRTAEEPDRTRKYIGPATSTDGTSLRRSHLQYDEDRQGWTWGTKAFAYPWEEIVRDFDHLFPLVQVAEPKEEHRLIGFESISLKPSGPHVEGGEGQITFATYDALQDFTIHLHGHGVAYLDFTAEQAAQLRDFLNANVKTTQA